MKSSKNTSVNTPENDSATTGRPSAPRRLLASVRDELRERRQDRAEYRALERDLASYTTRSQVDDLLVAVDHSGSRDAERIRGILVRNLEHRQRTYVAS